MNIEHPDITKMRLYGTLSSSVEVKKPSRLKRYTLIEAKSHPYLTENKKNDIIYQKTKKDKL